MVSRLDRVCVRGSAAACANRSRHPAASFLRQKKKTRRCVPTNHTQAVFCFACRLWELLTSGASISASMTNLASLFQIRKYREVYSLACTERFVRIALFERLRPLVGKDPEGYG